MDKIKRYIDCYIPTETCNFRCHYCYIVNYSKFNNKLFKLTHTPKEIKKALSKKRLGGTCLINLCAGGETLLSNDVIPVARALLEEGHYVMLVTNGSLTKRFQEISELPKELLDHLFFKFSFHYLELKRMNLLDKYFDNINLMKKSGASFTVEITPNDELEPYIDEIKQISMEKLGALPHITIGRKDIKEIPVLTNHNLEDYYKIWEQFDSKLITYKKQIFGKKIKEYCYGGLWSLYLNIETGELKQCYNGSTIDNIYENPEKDLKFCPIGKKCNMPHCYNGHSFIVLGTVPDMEAPYYDELRNRVCTDGTEWLTQSMREFMHTKLIESNEELEENEKKIYLKKLRAIKFKNKYEKIKRKIHEKK